MYILKGLHENHVDVDILCPYTHGRRRAKSTQISPEIGPNFQNTGLEIEPRFPAKPPPPEIGAQFGPLVAGIEPATFRLQACAPPTRPNSGGQHGHTSSFATWPSPPVPGPTKIPKSKIQTPNGPFGFWILDFGFRILDFGFWILDFGFRILILDFGFRNFGFRILDFGFGLWRWGWGGWGVEVRFGFRILGFWDWILDFWILDFGWNFGFWILDFWISDFGFWILDFGLIGFWISDFGFLDFGSV